MEIITPQVGQSRSRDVWSDVLTRIETQVDRHTFYSFWRDSVLIEDTGPVLLVRLKNERLNHELIAGWIQRHFTPLLAAVLQDVRPGTRVEFRFAVRPSVTQQRKSG